MAGPSYCNVGDADCSTAEASLDFGRFRVLLRRRLLVADNAAITLGARAFELLLALLEADGELVTKEHLMARVWPGITVGEENLKAQIWVLRRALGSDRDFIRAEHGRGYRFTGPVRANIERDGFQGPPRFRSWSTRGLFPHRRARRSQGWALADRFGSHSAPGRDTEAASRRD